MAVIYVLYPMYGGDENCDAPEGIAYTEEEAQKYVNKNPQFNTYAEFDVDVEQLDRQQVI